MTSLVRHLTFDCHDAYRQGTFWAEVLGGSITDDDRPGDPEALVEADGISLLFVTVPDAKTVKNRVHVDLQPQDRTRDEEVERLLTLGAKVHDDQRRPDGRGWVTLTDPEGNEFCVERSAAEREAFVEAAGA
ncbi:VOC family protein [Streptomyces alfalfae]|uniref:Glyoxalase n=1 Tax=Streptomyces alfalfae TaxID=1642299 RepID=A0A1P8TJF0_9ACTN|nr:MULTISPECIES: VOC family protein [Streptomyces]AYA18163.1 VOC family protein [Streptomyces fradiae]APY87735.1 glyoxalase [Streptomyces alfalfae]KUL47846.1 glyoxalase [Streptomyces sp. NRRL S-1521]QQC89904.1 VOC family protein [Streptomyces alfalfae]QUI32282.1 VOC family protein [Streptomyces alfalfae]